MQYKPRFERIMVVTLLAICMKSGFGQSAKSSHYSEQTFFNGEPDTDNVMVKHPVKLPSGVLDEIRKTLTGGVANCMESFGSSPRQAIASWFLASPIHLNGPSEVDLIVLPNTPVVAKPSYPGGCILGGRGGPFWILAPDTIKKKYRLLLLAYAGGLEVLGTKTNGYRDIRAGTGLTTATYEFRDQQYQLVKQETQPEPQ
jgi:hypothetical protein